MTSDDLLNLFQNVGVYSRGGERAPYKPLLLLLALGQLERGGGRWIRFRDIEEPLKQQMLEFGPPRARTQRNPNYPFWYLKTSEGLWQVKDEESLAPRKGKASGEPSSKELRNKDAEAGFTENAYRLLDRNPRLREQAVRMLLDANFPDTIHQDVLNAVGLSLDDGRGTGLTPRDPAFREKILQAYSYCCAVCGYDGRLGRQPVGIEAAHIRWIQFGGPNDISNGLCLCALHHKMFDMGAFTVRPDDYRLVFSNAMNGTSAAIDQLLVGHNKPLRVLPRDAFAKPLAKHLKWHWTEVFRAPEVRISG